MPLGAQRQGGKSVAAGGRRDWEGAGWEPGSEAKVQIIGIRLWGQR